MRKLYFSLALCATLNVVGAASLTLEVAPFRAYQQTTNSPCVVGNNSCGPKPLLFDPLPYTQLPNGSGTSYDEESPLYTVANIRSIVGNNFFIGADFN